MVKGITYILVNDPTTASLVGENHESSTAKIYPVIATQKESMPLVTVWESGREPQWCKGKRADTFIYRYELHVYALDYDDINGICNAIEQALYAANTDNIINGVKFISQIECTNRRDVGYVDEYKAYAKIISFQAMVYEGQTT